MKNHLTKSAIQTRSQRLILSSPFHAINCVAFPQGKKTPKGVLTTRLRAIHPHAKAWGFLAY